MSVLGDTLAFSDALTRDDVIAFSEALAHDDMLAFYARSRLDLRRILLLLRRLLFGLRLACLLGLRLALRALEVGKFRQLAARQPPHEVHCCIISRRLAPFVDRAAGDVEHVAARFPRQGAAVLQPLGDAAGAGG